MRDLASIRVLWRQPDTMALYGIPYGMRTDVGQSPHHIREEFRKGWIWLGSPGWFGSLTPSERAETEEFLTAHAAEIPEGPCEWCPILGAK